MSENDCTTGRRCPWCGLHKSADDFYRRSPSGKTRPECRACTIARQRARRMGSPLLATDRGFTPDERRAAFWAKVDQSGGPDVCWPWMAARTPAGYGHFWMPASETGSPSRMWLAHRVSYLYTHGEIPVDLDILHRCDSPPCCNPACLFPGTHTDNMRDCASKGRTGYGAHIGARGSACHSSRLTETDIPIIRAAVAAGQTRRSVARLYGVWPAAIGDVVSGKTWSHVKEDGTWHP